MLTQRAETTCLDADSGWLASSMCGPGRPWTQTRAQLLAGLRVDHGKYADSGALEYSFGYMERLHSALALGWLMLRAGGQT